jgi:hypothetical protein
MNCQLQVPLIDLHGWRGEPDFAYSATTRGSSNKLSLLLRCYEFLNSLTANALVLGFCAGVVILVADNIIFS